MKAETVVQVLCAAHLSWAVESRWQERGGLILVAPPGQIKTTFLMFLEQFYGAYVSTDLNSQMMAKLKDDIIAERIRTIVIPDIQKLYERHTMVSGNLEGTLRSMMEEGFIASSHQDASCISRKAKALFISAATPSFYEDKLQKWRQSGFARRVIFCIYTLSDPDALLRAVDAWQRLEIKQGHNFSIPTRKIPYSMTSEESKRLRHFMRKQTDTTPLVLLKKIACVLRWRWKLLKQRGPDPTMAILKDFSESLSGEGAKVDL